MFITLITNADKEVNKDCMYVCLNLIFAKIFKSTQIDDCFSCVGNTHLI